MRVCRAVDHPAALDDDAMRAARETPESKAIGAARISGQGLRRRTRSVRAPGRLTPPGGSRDDHGQRQEERGVAIGHPDERGPLGLASRASRHRRGRREPTPTSAARVPATAARTRPAGPHARLGPRRARRRRDVELELDRLMAPRLQRDRTSNRSRFPAAGELRAGTPESRSRIASRRLAVGVADPNRSIPSETQLRGGAKTDPLNGLDLPDVCSEREIAGEETNPPPDLEAVCLAVQPKAPRRPRRGLDQSPAAAASLSTSPPHSNRGTREPPRD